VQYAKWWLRPTRLWVPVWVWSVHSTAACLLLTLVQILLCVWSQRDSTITEQARTTLLKTLGLHYTCHSDSCPIHGLTVTVYSKPLASEAVFRGGYCRGDELDAKFKRDAFLIKLFPVQLTVTLQHSATFIVSSVSDTRVLKQNTWSEDHAAA